MINQVILIGRLGGDPEDRSSGNTDITTFSMATDSGWGDRKRTDWHSIKTFGKTAEACMQYLSKGRLVYVCGRIEYYKDNDGRWWTTIIANEVKFLGGGEDNGGQRSNSRGPRNNSHSSRSGSSDSRRGSSRRQRKQRQEKSFTPIDDDDVPF